MTPNIKLKMIGTYGSHKAGDVVKVASGSLRKILIDRGLAAFAEPIPARRKTKRELRSGKAAPAAKKVEFKITFRGGRFSNGELKPKGITST